METLPLDILLNIIELFASGDDEDIKSLQSLSQACKSMVPLCRKHLFSSLHIRSRLSSERFSDLISNNPDIACYVRSLNYRIYYHVSDHELNVLDVLEKHSSLQSIEISTPGLHWNDLPEAIRSSLVSLIQLPTITYLTILSINRFPAMVLSGCSNLIDLQLRDMKLAPAEVNQVVSRSKIPSPVSLYIDETTSGVAACLKSASDSPIVDFSCLQKAKFVVKSRPDIVQVNELIKGATRLEYLSMRLIAIAGLSMWLEGLDASLVINSCRTLKSLALRMTVVGKYHSPLSGLCPELKFIAGNNVLEELELDLAVQVGSSVRSGLFEDWSAFDSMLTESGAFPMLHRVSVRIGRYPLSKFPTEHNAVLDSEILKEDLFPRLVESKAVVFKVSTEIRESLMTL